MHQDDDLIRSILMEIADSGIIDGRTIDISVDGYTAEQIAYHVYLLHRAGMVEAIDFSSLSGFAWKPTRLTWEGQSYLKAISNQAVWQRVLSYVKERGGGASVEILQSLAIEFAKQRFLPPS